MGHGLDENIMGYGVGKSLMFLAGINEIRDSWAKNQPEVGYSPPSAPTSHLPPPP